MPGRWSEHRTSLQACYYFPGIHPTCWVFYSLLSSLEITASTHLHLKIEIPRFQLSLHWAFQERWCVPPELVWCFLIQSIPNRKNCTEFHCTLSCEQPTACVGHRAIGLETAKSQMCPDMDELVRRAMLQENMISSVTQVPSHTPLLLPDHLDMLGNNCL